MALPLLNVRPLPVVAQRKPQENIPQSKGERELIKKAVERYIQEFQPVPPMSMDELREHSESLIRAHALEMKYRDYVAVLINNEAWREILATIPYERRLLLLPKCLRDESRCPAPFDEFGLLCKQCGLCSIQDLEKEADRLGYAVLVAEGSAVVMKIIETGKIEAIVGVSCLNVLERAFPYMEAAAIPGISIPLLQDDCADCTVDLDWVWDVVHLTSEDKTQRMDLDRLRDEVKAWFSEETLDRIMGPARDETERIARDWLMKTGKRWRPYLTVCAHQALQEDPDTEIPLGVMKLAVAVECFHKASLIHDDIEDADHERYGEPTLHEERGLAIALNIGDLLLGEGYRLIGECGADPGRMGEMLRIAATGQRNLCLGQGAELNWMNKPEPLSSAQVLEIFRRKTSPAFEVALRLGTLYAEENDELNDVLQRYSDALGIAYQIRDDLNDWIDMESATAENLRPSILLAMAHERASGESKETLAQVWRRAVPYHEVAEAMHKNVMEPRGIHERTRRLMETYKEEAIMSLKEVSNPSYKGLLRRVIGKIFNDLEIKGWCNEFEARNAASRETVTQNLG